MNTKTKKIRDDLLYPELSYEIVGILFEIYNELGHGHPEKTYQKAVALRLEQAGIRFVEQLYAPVEYRGKVIGKNFFDFLIDDKIVLEIKKGNYFSRIHIDQVNKYLAANNLQLGILAYFAPRTVHFKRIVNIKN
jgi:GxxExxY protein